MKENVLPRKKPEASVYKEEKKRVNREALRKIKIDKRSETVITRPSEIVKKKLKFTNKTDVKKVNDDFISLYRRGKISTKP